MNIEQKAKAYDEALERAREWKEKYGSILSSDGTIAKDFDSIFPELRESEDEKIRKDIVAAVEMYGDFTQSRKEEIYAYLEKQKDASKAIEAVDRIDKYIDDHLANAHDMKDSNPDKKYYRGWDDALGKMAGILQDVYSEKENKFAPRVLPCSAAWFEDGDEKQTEQKPNYCHHEVDETGWTEEYRKAYYDGWNNCNMQHSQLKAEQKPVEIDFEDWDTLGYIRDIVRKHVRKDEEFDVLNKWLTEHYVIQKPAEWDDYTKTNLDRAIQIIKKAKGNLQGYQTDDGIYECDKAIEALEHFLYRGLEIEKSAELSDEDEVMLKEIIAFFKDGSVKLQHDLDLYAGFLEKRLKSLRPSWKPSEEELVALKNVGGILRDYGHGELAKMVFIIEGKLANLAVLNKSIWKPSEEQMNCLCTCVDAAIRKHNESVGEYKPAKVLKSLYEQLQKLM